MTATRFPLPYGRGTAFALADPNESVQVMNNAMPDSDRFWLITHRMCCSACRIRRDHTAAPLRADAPYMAQAILKASGYDSPKLSVRIKNAIRHIFQNTPLPTK